MSENVLDFKINLEKFKSFYNFSNIIIDKIEGNPRYLENKKKFNRKKGNNIYIHT